jgi:hypothetical protein
VSEFLQEAKSSVKVTMNAKGEAQVEVKVYSGSEDAELDETRRQAIRIYQETVREVRR